MLYLPGSRRNRTDEPEDPTTAGLSSGRFTEAQITLLGEIVEWWSNRRGQDDTNDPLRTLLGGVDYTGTCRTVGTVPATVSFTNAPVPVTPPSDFGRSFFVQALGIPDPPTVGEVYSLVGLCHFFYDASEDSWFSRYNTIARAPSGTTSTEVRTSVDPGGTTRSINIYGVTGLDIDWKVELIALEL